MCGKYDIGVPGTKGVYIGQKSKHVLLSPRFKASPDDLVPCPLFFGYARDSERETESERERRNDVEQISRCISEEYWSFDWQDAI